MIGNLVQNTFRFIFSFNFNFKLDDVELPESLSEVIIDEKGPFIPKNLKNGIANATYSNRFVILPIDYFTAIFFDKDVSQVKEDDILKLCSQNLLNDKRTNIEEFVKEFNKWRTLFLESYESQLNKQNEALQVIREEIFHNKHLKGTTTWNFSQSLTIFYRLSTAYLTYYRNKQGFDLAYHKDHIPIAKSLLNSYFIRQHLSKNTTIIVEAFYHYKDEDLESVKNLYGRPTYNFCMEFLELDEYFEKCFTTEKDELLVFFSKIVLNYPFAMQVSKYSKLEYNLFVKYYHANPINRFITIKDFIIQNKFSSSSEMKTKIESLLSKSSNLEYSFASSLVFYGTEGIVPKKLFSFLINRTLLTKYRKVVFSLFKDLITGGKKFNESYKEYPAIWSFGPKDEKFNIDSEIRLFKGETFFIAQNSLEPTILGENGHKDIINSEKCIPLLIQTIYIKAVYCVCDTEWEKESFIKEFDLSFRARPYINSHRVIIESEILPYFYNLAIKYKKDYIRNIAKNLEVFDDNFVINFERDILVLVDYVNNLEEITRKKFLTLCDLNYAHGY